MLVVVLVTTNRSVLVLLLVVLLYDMALFVCVCDHSMVDLFIDVWKVKLRLQV